MTSEELNNNKKKETYLHSPITIRMSQGVVYMVMQGGECRLVGMKLRRIKCGYGNEWLQLLIFFIPCFHKCVFAFLES